MPAAVAARQASISPRGLKSPANPVGAKTKGRAIGLPIKVVSSRRWLTSTPTRGMRRQASNARRLSERLCSSRAPPSMKSNTSLGRRRPAAVRRSSIVIQRRRTRGVITSISAALPGEPQPPQFLLEPRRQVATVERESEVGAEKSQFRAAIVGSSVEPRAMERLRASEVYHGVGQLDFPARALFHPLENLENLRLKNVAPRNDEIGGRRPLLRLLDHLGDLESRPMVGANADNAILMGFGRGNLFNRDNIAAMLLVSRHALGKAASAMGSRPGDHIRQQDREGLAADDFARAPDGVAEAEGRLLAGEAGRAGGGKIGHERVVFGFFPASLERVFELVGIVEMILDDAFVAAGHEDKMLDSRLARFIHHVLKNRPVDDGQHLLWDRLGRGQKPRTETGDGQHGFANGFVHGGLVPRSMGG